MTSSTPEPAKTVEEILSVVDEVDFYTYDGSPGATEVKELLRPLLTSHSHTVREQTEKAFGGCTKCYGKGYSTQMLTEIGHEDFGGEGYVKGPDVIVRFCACERGQQLDTLIRNLTNPQHQSGE